MSPVELMRTFPVTPFTGTLLKLAGRSRVGYAPSAMYSVIELSFGAGFFMFSFFVVAPSLAAAIVYAAWKGKPKNFDRKMYWTAFAAAIGVSAFLFVFAQRMQADVRTWQYPVQVACFVLAALLSGVAGGCMIGIFAYRRGVRN